VRYIKAMDLILTSAFTIEAILKIIGNGFLFCGPESYIRNTSNACDFSIVIFCILEEIMTKFVPITNMKMFKVIRISRVIKPLKLIGANRGLKLAIQALIVAIPVIANQLIIALLFFSVFAIIGVNLFKG